MTTTLRSKLAMASLFFLLLMTGVCLFMGYSAHQRLKETYPVEPQTLVIESGASFRSIVDTLHRRGIVRYPSLLLVYARLTQLAPRVQAGEYEFSGALSSVDVLELLVAGDTLAYKVTLVEGKRLTDWLAVLWRQPKLAPTLQPLASNPNALSEHIKLLFNIEAKTPEGWFFPETYAFSLGDSDVDVLERAHQKMQRILADAWQTRQPALPYTSPYEALIMASIIEKETGVPEERRQIAGVFVRRLNKKMRLQTDPTVIYGLGDEFDGDLKRVHLRQDSNPYNTYRIFGLPPTPIAMPGEASIRAAVDPEPGDTLFFVAKGDGSHVFSTTLEAHNRAVRQYQLKRRQDYRSAPN